MSSRNTLENKRTRRARRTLRKGRLPAYINLIEWIKMRGPFTTATARKIILSGALKVDSHVLGFEEKNGIKVLKPLVPADLRGRIQIVLPETLRDVETD